MTKSANIVTHSQLNHYFFEELLKLNLQIPCPMNQEILFYSSELLNKYAFSEKFFKVSPYSAINLAMAKNHSHEKRRESLRDIAETSLLRCGYFSHAQNGLLDFHHYESVGIKAYEQLHKISPEFLGIRSFYLVLATRFSQVCEMMQVLASRDKSDPDARFIAKAAG